MTTISTKETIAEICLDQMEAISAIAVRHGPATNLDANLAYANTATAEAGIDAVRKGLRNLDQRTRALVKEPLVAWLRVIDEEGRERTLLVSRHTTVTGVDGMTTRDAPMGRLASFAPGDGENIPGQGFIEVLERSIFEPLRRDGEWDGIEALIEREEKRPLSNIASLRALLEAKDAPAGDPFGFDAVPASVRRIRRDSTLKDIAILDQWQDAVFRRDPGDRVLLLGPPGTGKTTTLVKRVAFHLNTQPVEPPRDPAITLGGTVAPHEWVLFSPTPLLRDFAKEAFAREEVVAGDERMRVWAIHRDKLSLGALELLKRGARGRGLVLNREPGPYPPAAEQIIRLTAFEDHDREGFRDTMRAAVDTVVREDDAPEGIAALSRAFARSEAELLLTLSDAAGEIEAWRRDMSKRTNTFIDRRVDTLVKGDPVLAGHIRSVVEASMNGPSETDDEGEDEDGQDRPAEGRLTRDLLNRRIRGAILAWARRGKKAGRGSQGELLNLLPDDMFTEEERARLGHASTVLRAARPLTRPVRERLDVLKRYRTFETKKGRASATVDAHILDLLVAAKLRLCGALCRDVRILTALSDPRWTPLAQVAGCMRNAVLVDETPDFSPLELAGMLALSNPHIGGLIMAGDMAQRLTRHGLRDEEEARAVIPGLEIVEIEKNYRQSASLDAFCRMLRTPGTTPPPLQDIEDVAPALLEKEGENEACWIAAQVNRVYEDCNALPSVAVFVPDEADIAGMTARLDTAFSGTNFRAQACTGNTLGEAENIRVFAMERVKGLEFEAAFVTGLDVMQDRDADMARQHLYVGASRPARFLGLTSARPVPLLDDVRSMCVQYWT